VRIQGKKLSGWGKILAENFDGKAALGAVASRAQKTDRYRGFVMPLRALFRNAEIDPKELFKAMPKPIRSTSRAESKKGTLTEKL
jgi:hypothetical protein